jgi:hypothetical protein
VVVGVVAGLIFMQPDLSTALLIVLTAGTMFSWRRRLASCWSTWWWPRWRSGCWCRACPTPGSIAGGARLDNPAQRPGTRQALIAIGQGGRPS